MDRDDYEPMNYNSVRSTPGSQQQGAPNVKSRRPIPLPKPQKYDEIQEVKNPPHCSTSPPIHSPSGATARKPVSPVPTSSVAPPVPKRAPRVTSRSTSEDFPKPPPVQSKPRSSSVLEDSKAVPPPLPTTPIPSRKKASQAAKDPRYQNTTASPDLTKRSLTPAIPISGGPEKSAGLKPSKSVESSLATELGTSPSHITGVESPVLNLASFVAKHSNELPLRVRVEEGYCGREERDVISSGDVYNFHFVKKEKVITIQDQGGNPYLIPLNSSVQFGLLYNPNSNLNEALKGFNFQSVSEIVAQKTPPQVVCVSEAHQANSPRSSVEANEKLIVKKVGKTAMKRKPFMKVFSLKTKEEKTLHDDCNSCFITDPYSIRLYLPDILDHFGESLPLKATLYADMDTSQDQPFHLSSDVVTLTHVSIESSIIASTCWDDEDHSNLMATRPSEEDCIPIGIPISLDIEVVVLPDDYENERLYADTRVLFETFDPQKVKTCGKGQNGSGKSRLFSAIREGFEKQGFEIQKPSRIYDVPQVTIPTTSSIDTEESQTQPASPKPPANASQLPKEVVRDIPLHMIASQGKPVSKLTSSRFPTSEPFDVGHEISELKASIKAIKSLVDALQEHTQKQVNSVRADLARITPVVDDLNRNYQQLATDVYNLKQQFAAGSSGNGSYLSSQAPEKGDRLASNQVSSSPSSRDPEREEKNREDLGTFDHIKVLQLLEVMNMKQYQDVFIEEQVDGDLLLECDDAVLMHELKVTSKLHRSKLMKLITGRHCASTVLLGLDPYVILERKDL